MINKKAMSGLIITVLLVAIALAIGAMVMGWISSYSRDTMGGAQVNQLVADACQKLDVQVIKIEINDTSNTSGTYNEMIKVFFENNGEQELAGAVIRGLTDNEGLLAGELVLGTYLGKYQRTQVNVTGELDCETDGCRIGRVRITPMVEVNPGTPEIHSCDNMDYNFLRSDSVIHLLNE